MKLFDSVQVATFSFMCILLHLMKSSQVILQLLFTREILPGPLQLTIAADKGTPLRFMLLLDMPI
jgi:hypothetical protein